MPHGNNGINGNPSAPTSLTISAVPGITAAISSGVVLGARQAISATSDAIKELNSADSATLLNALDVLSKAVKAKEDKKAPGLNLFPNEIEGMLEGTQVGVATTAQGLSLAPVISLSHLAQLPLDVQACIKGLLHSVHDYKDFLQTKQASTLDLAEQKSGFSANSQALYNNLREILDALDKNINEEFPNRAGAALTHARSASTSAFPVATSALGTASLIALVFDSIGALFRDVSALVEFSKGESSNPQADNVYKALAECCRSGSKSQNSIESLIALRELEKALSNFGPASALGGKHIVSSPTLSVFFRMITSAPFVKTLQSVISSSIALSEAQNALKQEKDNFSQATKQSASQASLIKDFSNGDAVNHSKNVSEFCDRFDAAIAHIDNDLHAIPDIHTIATSAASTVRSIEAVVIASSMVTGLFGIVSREFSGSIDFTKNDKGTKEECGVVSQSRPDMTGADLDKLLTRVSALQERLVRCQELGVSAPVVMGLSESVTVGSLIASLNMLAGMFSALRELHTLSQSPSIPLQLNDAEKLKAQKSVESVENSNRNTAGSMGTADVSNNLSMNHALLSVMEKVVLLNRSHRNFLQPNMPRNDIDYSAKSTIAFSQGNSTGFTVGLVGASLLTALQSGITTEASVAGLRVSTAKQRMSDGPDKIVSYNGSKSNTSALSNATRLSEESMQSSTVLQSASRTTYLAAESTFSRSVIVALCHSGALTEILRRLVQEEQERVQHAPGYLDSAQTSAAVYAQLENKILQVLNEAEAKYNPIPGLNSDMASTLASVSKASIASALCVNSSLISPFLKTMVATKAAKNIPDDLKNEALSGSQSSQTISTALNMVQAFTRNFAVEMGHIENPIKNSSLAKTADDGIGFSIIGSCFATLVIEELFESSIGRSFALLDREKMDATAKKSRENTKKQADISRQAVADDSGSDQNSSFTHVVSALRLTLSHLGVSLSEIAGQIEKDPKLLKDNLQMHSSQKRMLTSMISSLHSCGSSLLSISAALSVAPLSSAGTVDALRECLHSIDRHLILKPVFSSQDSTVNSGSECSLLTGITTDCVSSLLSTVIKLLIQGSILGLDTSLSIAKLMEILCIHPRPEQAISLEFQASSQPNGLSNNTNVEIQSVSVATTLGVAGFAMATKSGTSDSTDKTLQSLQKEVDERINYIELLGDEEESNNEEAPSTKLGLKGFYEILIRVLASEQSCTRDNVNDLITRFDRGGIALSRYHSDHGGMKSSKSRSNDLIRDEAFLNCDNAGALLVLFNNKAFHSEYTSKPLLTKVREELNKYEHLSTKANARWDFIVHSVMDRVKLENSRVSITKENRVKMKNQDLADRKTALLHPERIAINPLYHATTSTSTGL